MSKKSIGRKFLHMDTPSYVIAMGGSISGKNFAIKSNLYKMPCPYNTGNMPIGIERVFHHGKSGY